MNRAPVNSTLLFAGLMLFGGGCSLPQQATNRLPSTAQSGRVRTPVAQDAVPTGHSGSLDSANSAAVSGGTPGKVTPVSYHVGDHPASATGPGVVGDACVACNPLGASAGCGPASPYGYAAQPAIYNLYGIDPQEFLCDGGDHPPDAAVLLDGSVGGLQPEDTVVHYTTEGGDLELKESNRVCIYAPRFSAVRRITGAVAGQKVVGAVGVERPVGPIRIELNQPGLAITETTSPIRASNAKRIDAMRDRNRGVPVEGVLQLEQAGDVLAALAGIEVLELQRLQREELALLQQAAIAAVTWTEDLAVEVAIMGLKPPVLTRNQSVEGVTVYDFPDAGRLRIAKLADRHHAHPGEVVNFIIRVENVGDSAVDQVVLTDNLTTRLEYVEGSQTSDLTADFDAAVNDGQSLRLKWSFNEPLGVGESATVRFQCRVR